MPENVKTALVGIPFEVDMRGVAWYARKRL